jgi:hypothetical protein
MFNIIYTHSMVYILYIYRYAYMYCACICLSFRPFVFFSIDLPFVCEYDYEHVADLPTTNGEFRNNESLICHQEWQC